MTQGWQTIIQHIHMYKYNTKAKFANFEHFWLWLFWGVKFFIAKVIYFMTYLQLIAKVILKKALQSLARKYTFKIVFYFSSLTLFYTVRTQSDFSDDTDSIVFIVIQKIHCFVSPRQAGLNLNSSLFLMLL